MAILELSMVLLSTPKPLKKIRELPIMNICTHKTTRNSLLPCATFLGLMLLSPVDLCADQVISDDLIVNGSACIGIDCVNGESFGFDTIRLKENNLRIGFDDTSASATFPNVDWQITINDSANGGANKFSIEDITGAKIPFTIEAGADNHSLYVDDLGKIGLGTNSPALELHIADNDTPAVRLEQDGSSGWTPQIWDIAGNEANFFIRDVTNSSKLPFRINPGAPTDSLTVKADGKVGLGTYAPVANLHVRDTTSGGAGKTLLKLSNDGNPKIEMTNESTANTWTLGGGATFNVLNNAGDQVLRLGQDGIMTVQNNGTTNAKIVLFNVTTGSRWTLGGGVSFNILNNAGVQVARLATDGTLTLTGELITAGNTCGGGCDKTFSNVNTVESVEEHAKKMWEYSYLPAVGPTKENAPLNLSQKTAGMLNELEKAHIYIEQLNNRLKHQEERINHLISRLEQSDTLK